MSNKANASSMRHDGKPALVPKLRFPEFRDATWITEPLRDFASITTERAGDEKCILMSITSGVGLVSQMEKFGRTIAGNQFRNYFTLSKNDFAYNKSATKDYPQGFIAMYSGDELAAVPNSIFTCFSVRAEKVVPKYLDYLFQGNLHGKWVKKFIEVSARAHGSLSIDDEDLLSLPVPLPSGEASLAEQQKIAECLSSVDKVIAAHARKLDALKTHKQALMQQLFPREGETQPRLRFPEFQGEWEQTQLENLCDSISSGRDQNDADGKFALYGSTGIIGKTTRPSFIGQRILVARVGANAGLLTKAVGQFGVTDNTLVVSLKPSITTDYIFHYLGTVNINRLIFGSGQPLITGSILKNLKILLPVDSEQQKISACLSSLDALIIAQGNKLEALKTHKKGLMQQLFPSQEVVQA